MMLWICLVIYIKHTPFLHSSELSPLPYIPNSLAARLWHVKFILRTRWWKEAFYQCVIVVNNHDLNTDQNNCDICICHNQAALWQNQIYMLASLKPCFVCLLQRREKLLLLLHSYTDIYHWLLTFTCSS